MSKINIASNSYITLEYYPEGKYLYHTIHQPISGQPNAFKDVLNAGTEALKEYGLDKWLSDDRNNGPLPKEILDWAANEWYVRTIEAGWKYWANVVTHDVNAAGTLVPVIHQLSSLGLRMQVITDVNRAIEWLNAMSN
jgi:hypothetical protein